MKIHEFEKNQENSGNFRKIKKNQEIFRKPRKLKVL